MTATAATITGSPKQISWASKIRGAVLDGLASVTTAPTAVSDMADDYGIRVDSDLIRALATEIAAHIASIPQARWWIDHGRHINAAILVSDVWMARNPVGNGVSASRACSRLEIVGLSALSN